MRFDCLTATDGLSFSLVTSILQDQRGFMWFGTRYGLDKYDGKNFTVYLPASGIDVLLGNYIYDTYQDRTGSLWLSTYAASTDMNAGSAQQLICADTRAADDPSGIHLLKRHFSRLTQCAPLEMNASGLVVFTQDWRVARKLIDDAATVEHEYIVEVAGELAPDGLKLLNHGLHFKGRALPPIKVSCKTKPACGWR